MAGFSHLDYGLGLRRAVWAGLLLLALGAPCSALAKSKAPAADPGGSSSFVDTGAFSFGMSLPDAEKVVMDDAEHWQVVFRIDTPSTADMAVVFERRDFYRVSFYQGLCYSIEKRGDLPVEDAEACFKALGEQYGETPEATRSDDGSLVYSRWHQQGLDLSFTASAGSEGSYRATFEQTDPLKMSTARRKQEAEMAAAPQTLDPLTGKPLLHQQAGSEAAADKAAKVKAAKSKADSDSSSDSRAGDSDAKAGSTKEGDAKTAVDERAAREAAEKEKKRKAKEAKAKKRAEDKAAKAAKKAKDKDKAKDSDSAGADSAPPAEDETTPGDSAGDSSDENKDTPSEDKAAGSSDSSDEDAGSEDGEG